MTAATAATATRKRSATTPLTTDEALEKRDQQRIDAEQWVREAAREHAMRGREPDGDRLLAALDRIGWKSSAYRSLLAEERDRAAAITDQAARIKDGASALTELWRAKDTWSPKAFERERRVLDERERRARGDLDNAQRQHSEIERAREQLLRTLPDQGEKRADVEALLAEAREAAAAEQAARSALIDARSKREHMMIVRAVHGLEQSAAAKVTGAIHELDVVAMGALRRAENDIARVEQEIDRASTASARDRLKPSLAAARADKRRAERYVAEAEAELKLLRAEAADAPAETVRRFEESEAALRSAEAKLDEVRAHAAEAWQKFDSALLTAHGLEG